MDVTMDDEVAYQREIDATVPQVSAQTGGNGNMNQSGTRTALGKRSYNDAGGGDQSEDDTDEEPTVKKHWN